MGANQKKNAVHACGRVTSSTGAATNPGTGNWSAANSAAGLVDITMSEPIDTLERCIFATSKTIGITVAVVTASDTDTVFRLSQESDASVLTDSVVDFLVLRVAA